MLSKTRYSTNGVRQETFFFPRVLDLRRPPTAERDERFFLTGARARRRGCRCVCVEVRRRGIDLALRDGDDRLAGLRSRARGL